MKELSSFAKTILDQKYAQIKSDGTKETWSDVAERVASSVMRDYLPKIVPGVKRIIEERKFIPAGRYLYAAGRRNHAISNCLALSVEDSREGWAELLYKVTCGLMVGTGVGVVYSRLREDGAEVKGLGGASSGPLALMQIVNEAGRHIQQGGSRRSALWAGLNWKHPDAENFIKSKNWTEDVRAMKEKDFNFPAPLDMTNVSIMLDEDFFRAYHTFDHPDHVLAQNIFWKVVRRMCKTGEPGLTIDVGVNALEILRNPCAEFCSADDSTTCNLGSINLSEIESIQELVMVTELATAFLLCGSLYSTVPYPKVAKVTEQNRRIGLGLMGLHEWLLTRGNKYGPNDELARWLEIYQQGSDISADKYSKRLGMNRPKGVRAIAPTGTLSIIGGTSAGIEPIFCTAFKRRYLNGTTWHAQYVIDAAAERLIEQGIKPDEIEDAFTLSLNVERRIAFQAWIQQYVDMGISSTINLPPWGSEFNNDDTLKNFGNILMKYLPRLRGITTYPNGARGSAQPLTPVDYNEAKSRVGVEYEENGALYTCIGGVCGT